MNLRRRAAPSEPRAGRGEPFRLPWRKVSLALMILALVYAFLAGFHTVWDFDMGFHMATGRYVVQHHVIPSADVLSYTAKGAEWLYPPFAGVLFYGIYSAWGYAGLSWFCALTLMATIACLLRSPFRPESSLTTALAILAVPLLAVRTSPRPDLFTHLFFAIIFVQLWYFHQSGGSVSDGETTAALRWGHVRLWILPLTMLLWVNFHPGFVAGLGILFGYLFIEGLDLLFPQRRSAVLRRLRQAWPALAATVFATLINPYGFKIFKSALLIGNVQGPNLPSNGVDEWQALPLSFVSLSNALNWRYPIVGYRWLAVAAVVVIVLALWRRQFGAALLIAASLYFGTQHQRFIGLFSIVVVVAGSTILTEAFANRRQDGANAAGRWRGLRNLPAAFAVAALCVLTCVRIADVLSSRSYAMVTSMTQFGAGESWWFPERAAAFIQRERLPGNLFQTYGLGGFTAFRLGPAYPDFIDGRFDHLAPAVLTEEQNLIASPPDSPFWKTEADRRGINILLFSLSRIYGIPPPNLMSLCQSKEWRPIYMDDVSIVLLRNRSENRPWIDRDEVNCQTLAFTPPAHASRIELSNFYADAGHILVALGRYSDAMEALNHSTELAPDDPDVHFELAHLYEAQQQLENAEREYKTTLSLRGDLDISWDSLGRFYLSHGRYAEARPFIMHAIQLSTTPANEYILLGVLDTYQGQPQQALKDYARAEQAGSTYYRGREEENPGLFAQIDAGRAGAYELLGEWQRAIEFQLEATRRTPDRAICWKTLGKLYDKTGQKQLAEQAYQRAIALSK
jgi:Flp pilus assembly protein TadD